MAIDIIPDPTITVVEGNPEIVVVESNSIISLHSILQTIPDNSGIDTIISAGPVQSIIDASGTEILIQTVSDVDQGGVYSLVHGRLSNLLSDDHPQYLNTARAGALYAPISHVAATGNVHSLIATDIPGLGNWATLEAATDPAFILANMGENSIPSTRIASLVVGKLTAGVMTAKVSLAESFTASASGAILNDDMSGLLLGDERITMGFVTDTNATYMLRHYNGYSDASPNYLSNFSVDTAGNVRLAGNVIIAPGSSGILNLTDAGNLAARDLAVYYSASMPVGAIEGDVWYDLDDGNAPYRWNGSGWDSIKDSDIAIAQGTADGKIQTFYQDAEPTGMTAANNGDIWFDTNDGNKAYYYSNAGTAWLSAQDSAISTAIANAATAQSTADGKITTYTGLEPGTIDALGDLWFETATRLLHRATALGPPIVWEIVGNNFDDTNLLTDTANLGGTALWAGVTGDGTPADYADVTNIGSSNYVTRGLSSPNSIGGTVTQGSAGLGTWSVILGTSVSITSIVQFDLPPLAPNIDFVVSFWASSAVAGTTFWVDLFPDSLPEYEITLDGGIPVKFTRVFNSADVAMVNADLRFFKLIGSVNPADPVTIYDIKFERGTQATDWSPFIPFDDGADTTVDALERTVTIADGGIILDNGGAIHSTSKTSFADTDSGVYLGWDAIKANYVLNIGDANNSIKWDGTDLIVKTLKTATSGKRIVINPSGDNELHFYDTTGAQSATIGLSSTGTDYVIGQFGSTISPYVGIIAESDTLPAAFFRSNTTFGIRVDSYGTGYNAYGILAVGVGGVAVYASSTNNNGPLGGVSIQNGIRLSPQISPPTGLTAGFNCQMYLTHTNRLVIVYDDAGTIRYKYLPLAGTSTAWVHSTTPP
jgi:hypothetical protein